MTACSDEGSPGQNFASSKTDLPTQAKIRAHDYQIDRFAKREKAVSICEVPHIQANGEYVVINSYLHRLVLELLLFSALKHCAWVG